MDIKEIRANVDQYGYIGLHDVSEADLKKTICELTKELKDTELRYFAAMSPYHETGAKTEWEIFDKMDTLRNVWIVKKVTRMAGTDFEDIQRQHVIWVDRKIAQAMIDLLHTQETLGLPLPASVLTATSAEA
jgi:hypothetical protein